MAISRPIPPVNQPAKKLFVPMECYASALRLSLELALELRQRCDDEIHRDQVEQIDEALVEIGEGRPALQAIADRAKLVEIKHGFFDSFGLSYPFIKCRVWEQRNVMVSRREFDAVQLGQTVQTRGVLAFATMKTHEYQGKYFVRLEFKERIDA